jgi:hypothetical protein
MQFAVTFPHPGYRVEATLSQGTTKFRFLLYLVVEQTPIFVGAFQFVFFEELRPQQYPTGGSRS